MTDKDREAYEYYADPAHLAPAGPGRKPKRPAAASTMASVRFPAEVIEAVKDASDEEGITVSRWIRRLVQREIEPAPAWEMHIDGEAEPVRIPEAATKEFLAALMPVLSRYGALDLRIGTPAWQQNGPYFLTSYIPVTATVPTPRERGEYIQAHSDETAVEPSFGQLVPPRTIPSALRLKPRTFSCRHMSVGNVMSATCERCGPLEGVA